MMRCTPGAVCRWQKVSSDGVTLSGWYIRLQNSAAVILLHGYNANRMDTLNHAELLAHHGYGVLMYDLRGHGEREVWLCSV